MSNEDFIDVTFDLRDDETCKSREPDRDSKILYEYHKELWAKNLPSSEMLDIKDNTESSYLELKTDNHKFRFGSDWIINTYSHRTDLLEMKKIIESIPDSEINEFNRLAHTIGNFIIFPRSNDSNSKTINTERGNNPIICDRFDLTLECIRIHYIDPEKDNPLKEILKKYYTFFELFESFEHYCNFFFCKI